MKPAVRYGHHWMCEQGNWKKLEKCWVGKKSLEVFQRKSLLKYQVIINIPLVLAAISSLHKLIEFFFDFSAMQTWPTWLLVMLLFNGDQKKKKNNQNVGMKTWLPWLSIEKNVDRSLVQHGNLRNLGVIVPPHYPLFITIDYGCCAMSSTISTSVMNDWDGMIDG